MTSKCLDEIEGVDWGEQTFDSHLVETCHRLRKKPIDQFTPEDLRIMIGQAISPIHLVPLALDVLERDPLAGGDMYPGALLANVLRLPASFWKENPRLYYRASGIVTEIEIFAETLQGELLPAAKDFRAITP